MKRILMCLPVLFCLTGCEMLPFARELESTMLVQVLGVDWTQDGVTLTGADDSGSEEGSVLSASGRTMEEAERNLKGAGEQYVSLTHVTQLVLGAQTDLAAVLAAALEKNELSQSATVWIAREGTAQELMETVGGGGRRLSSIELNSDAQSVTVLQSLMRLNERGEVELPLLTREGATLVYAGVRSFAEESE